LLLWAFRLFGAWLVAAPVAAVLASNLAHLPRGDAALFEPGGGYLLEALRLSRTGLISTLRTSIWAGVLLGGLTLAPLCALMISLSHSGGLRSRAWAGATAAQLPAFILLSGLTLLGQAGVAVALGLTATVAHGWLQGSFDARLADLLLLPALALGLLLVVALGIGQDLARAALIRHRATVTEAVLLAWRAARLRPLKTLVDWMTPAVWGLAVVVGAAIVSSGLDVARPEQWRTMAVLLTHQLASLALVGLRANWLARALRLVDPRGLVESPPARPALRRCRFAPLRVRGHD
jgi:hypothetical protein